jgi:2-succinyl-6-hydroxy-2,4-cyclohexadiene-1-carboxylate synthase
VKATIWAIPGFLGLPTDWNFLQWKHLIGVDLYAFSWSSLSEWAMQLNEWVDSSKKKPSVLMGYSLGGRLALHALLDRPEQWQAAIIISAHPGLANDHERKKRRENDQKWAERFEREEWTSLMQAWNGQEVFAQDHVHFCRQEQDYQRSQLTQILIQGSVAQQEDLRKQIAISSVPLLWITGSNDRRYCQIAQDLTFAHPSRWQQIAQAGHRVPWEQPQMFFQIVKNFLEKIE